MTSLDEVIDAAVRGLFDVQRQDGSWQDTLPSAAVATGSAIIALHHADPEHSAGLVAKGAAWLRQAQGSDGGWGDAVGEPATLNATAIAVAALRIVAAEESADALRHGLELLDLRWGIGAVGDKDVCSLRAVCQQYLALAGFYDERDVVAIPVELALLPRRLRQKLSFTVPGVMSWGVMQARTRPSGPWRRAVRRLAEPRALAYLEGLQRYEGYVGGFEESPLMASIVCLGITRAGVRPEIARRCVDYLRRTVRPDGSWSVNRDLEFSASTFVVLGLQDAGQAADPRLGPTLDWLRACQRSEPFAPTGCPAGGWGWSLPSGWPDTDDTADALIALAGFGLDRQDPTVRRGVDWLLDMQNRDGSWGCFCRENRLSLDAPCTVMSAHAVTALRTAAGLTAADLPLRRAVRWFESVQRADGSIPCTWYTGSTAGTAAVLEALGGLGLAATSTAQRCQQWLLDHQDADGSWGGTVEETSWALLGLLAAGVAPARLRGGVDWLVERQRPDGLWAPSLIGIYFLDLLYSCDHLANGYALQALGRYQQASRLNVEETGG